MKYYRHSTNTRSNLQLTTMELQKKIMNHTAESASKRATMLNCKKGKMKLGCVVFGKRRKCVL